jgi:hypothetical protein
VHALKLGWFDPSKPAVRKLQMTTKADKSRHFPSGFDDVLLYFMYLVYFEPHLTGVSMGIVGGLTGINPLYDRRSA